MGPLGLCLLLLAAAPAPAESTFSYDLGAKLENWVGTGLPGSVGNEVTANFTLEPGIVLGDRWSTGKVELGYVPWLLYTPAVPDQLLALNRVRLKAQTELSRTMGITVDARLWVGDQTFSPVIGLAVPPGTGTGPTIPPPPGQLPAVSVLKIIDTSGRLGFYLNTSRRLRLEFDAGYLWSEGANAAARLQLPLQRGPFIEARVNYALGARDVLIPTLRSGWLNYGPIFRPAGSLETGGTVLISHFQTGLGLSASEVGLRWQHQETANLSTELAAGLGLIWESTSRDVPVDKLLWIPGGGAVPSNTQAYPLAGAKVRGVVPLARLDLSAGAALAPIVDRFSATVVQRAEASGAAKWSFAPRWTLEAEVAAAVGISVQQFDVRGKLGLTWQPDPHLLLSTGSRVAYVDYPTPSTLNGFTWVVYLSISAATGALL